jgi:hypothetical protein
MLENEAGLFPLGLLLAGWDKSRGLLIAGWFY